MNIIRATAAGRLVQAGPRLLFLSPPSLRGLGMVLAFLEGRIKPPEDAGTLWLPDLTGDEAFTEYGTPTGAALLLYITTRRDHPDLTMERAVELIGEMDDDSIASLVRSAFVRQVLDTSLSRPSRKASRGSQGCRGVESFDFAPMFEATTSKRFPPQILSEMSMDQFENVLSGGSLESEDDLTFDEVMEIYETHRPKKDVQ